MPHRLILRIASLLLPFSLIAQQPAPGGYQLKVTTDRPDAIYQANEKVIFKIALTRDGTAMTKGTVAYLLSYDEAADLDKGELALSDKPLSISGKLDFPGFLRCKVTFKNDAEKVSLTAQAGAGIEPLKIKPSQPVPDDFDSFWAAKKKALAQIPMDPVLTPIKSGKANLECFDVQVKCWDNVPVSAYLVKPKNAKPKSLPAIITFHAANVEGASIIAPSINAELGALALDVNPHGIANGKPAEFYQELANGKLRNYAYQGKENRDTCYFLGMFLRAIRAVDFLTSLPEWDGKVVIIRGSSMGGGQGFAVAGLDSRVTALAANAPALCEHTGTVTGWPRLVQRGSDGKPTDPRVFAAARYFDSMNFATRIKADTLVCVGFVDSTCRPTSVYAAYNNLPGKKRIINEPHMKHETFNSTTEAFRKFFLDHIQKMKAAQ